jgi:hypothetical protein
MGTTKQLPTVLSENRIIRIICPSVWRDLGNLKSVFELYITLHWDISCS